jgi:hypothetical protein
MRPAGYAGKLGYASAGAAADFIIVNMVAEGISGSKTPKEAMERAQNAPNATTGFDDTLRVTSAPASFEGSRSLRSRVPQLGLGSHPRAVASFEP